MAAQACVTHGPNESANLDGLFAPETGLATRPASASEGPGGRAGSTVGRPDRDGVGQKYQPTSSDHQPLLAIASMQLSLPCLPPRPSTQSSSTSLPTW